MSEHAVRKPSGTLIVTSEFGLPVTRDTLQCRHCGRHWVVEPGSGRSRGWCFNCAGPTCGAERCEKVCEAQEKMVERIEANWRRKQRILNG